MSCIRLVLYIHNIYTRHHSSWRLGTGTRRISQPQWNPWGSQFRGRLLDPLGSCPGPSTLFCWTGTMSTAIWVEVEHPPSVGWWRTTLFLWNGAGERVITLTMNQTLWCAMSEMVLCFHCQQLSVYKGLVLLPKSHNSLKWETSATLIRCVVYMKKPYTDMFRVKDNYVCVQRMPFDRKHW